jgi:hypothetical protein
MRVRCCTENRFDDFLRAVKTAAMTSRISHASFDAINAHAQSVFWSQVLDFTEDPGDPNEPGHEECLITSRDLSQLLLFITVPEPKTAKNRMHVDVLDPSPGAVDRLISLGATVAGRHEMRWAGYSWARRAAGHRDRYLG